MPPYEGEAISPEKREEIFQRLDEHMKEFHLRYEIQD
jgi:predicted small metal-binding protein